MGWGEWRREKGGGKKGEAQLGKEKKLHQGKKKEGRAVDNLYEWVD